MFNKNLLNHPEKLFMSIRDNVERVGDMHPTRALNLIRQSDDDVILVINQDGYAVGSTDTKDP